MLRDAVLEGVRPSEIEVLSRLSSEPAFHPDAALAERLEAKGWRERAGGSYLLTITGRTLIERRLRGEVSGGATWKRAGAAASQAAGSPP